jgi:hypothetical protein
LVNLPIPVLFYRSNSGKTYYAQIGINGEYFTGESTNYYDGAIEDLKKKLEKEYKYYGNHISRDH